MSSRNGFLDLLRAVAIASVLACHLVGAFAPGSRVAAVTGIGGRGVDLFFVLSGWLLGSMIWRELRDTGSLDVRRFWVRRWLRTLPAYYAVLALTSLQFVATGKAHLLDWRFLFFLQNYPPPPPYLGVTWSLCVEEHFYLLVAPLAVLAFRHRWGAALVGLLCATAAGLHAAGFYWVNDQAFLTPNTHARFEQPLVGVLLAWVSVFRPGWWARLARLAPFLVFASLVLLGVTVLNRTVWGWAIQEWGMVGWAAIFGSWVLYGVTAPRLRGWAAPAAVRFVALRAYSLYLVHVDAIAAARRVPGIGDLPAWVPMLISLAVAVVAAEVLYRLVERPFMDMRERFKGSRATPHAEPRVELFRLPAVETAGRSRGASL